MVNTANANLATVIISRLERSFTMRYFTCAHRSYIAKLGGARPCSNHGLARGSPMDFFAFIITLVLISTAAKILERRRHSVLPGESIQVDTEELHRIADTITDLSGRVERLEEERDFYKDLLEPPSGSRELPPPDQER